MATDLSLATFVELFDEITKRSRAALLVVERDAPAGQDSRVTSYCYNGGLNAAIGLASRVHQQLLNDNTIAPASDAGNEPDSE